MSFIGLLQVALIVLKLTGVIAVSWWIVLVPAIAVVIVSILTIAFIVLGGEYLISK